MMLATATIRNTLRDTFHSGAVTPKTYSLKTVH